MALGAHNPQMKRLRRLVRRRSSRQEEAAFVVEGPTLVGEALAAGLDIEAVFVDVDVVDTVDEAVAATGLVQEVESGVLHRVLTPSTPQPMAAVVRGALFVPLESVLRSAKAACGCILVLVDVSDPGNVGTIVRSAEAAGCVGVVTVGSTADLGNPKTLRASAGSALRIPVATDPSIVEVIERCRAEAIRTVATVARGGEPHRHLAGAAPLALLLGNEAHGLDDGVAAACDALVTIEMAGPTESLNVAMAATVLAFEATRPVGER